MDIAVSLISILGAIAIGAMSPGPSFLFVTRTAVAQSRRSAVAAAVGMGVGGLTYGTLGLLGLQTLIMQAQWLHLLLKFGGGLYLIWIATQLWRHASRPLAIPKTDVDVKCDIRMTFSFAVATQLSNPKAAIVYGSIFAAFLPPQPPSWAFAVLLLCIFLIEAGWYALVAVGFSSQRPRSVYLRSKRWIDRLAGLVMGLLGLRLLASAIKQ